MDVLRTAVSMLSLYDSEAQDMSAEANHRKAVRLMSTPAAIVTAFDRLRNGHTLVEAIRAWPLGQLPVHADGKRPDDVMERAFDVAMILHADHELNASTFAARVKVGDAFGHLFLDHFGYRRAQGPAARRRARRHHRRPHPRAPYRRLRRLRPGRPHARRAPPPPGPGARRTGARGARLSGTGSRGTRVRKGIRALMPTLIDRNPFAQPRSPMDMMRQGWSMRRFQALQQ